MPQFPDRARQLIHEKQVGPRPLARAAGVSSSTAAAWCSGKKRPEPERRRLLEPLGIPVEAWEQAPHDSTPPAAPPPVPLLYSDRDRRSFERWRTAIEREASPELRTALLAQLADLTARAPDLDADGLRERVYALTRACPRQVNDLAIELDAQAGEVA